MNFKYIKQVLSFYKHFSKKHEKLGSLNSKKAFLDYQKNYFNEQSWFASKEAVPKFIEIRIRIIVSFAVRYLPNNRKPNIVILDIGSGTGVLIPALKNNFPDAQIHAVDISANQLKKLAERHPDVICHHQDFNQFKSDKSFDIIFCNACFGNFYSQEETLTNIYNLLIDKGLLIISHPLGAKFVRKLHKLNNKIVPNLLPTKARDLYRLINELKFTILKLINKKHLYICVLQKILLLPKK